MSRNLNGTSDSLSSSVSPISTFPFSVNIWFKPDTLSGGGEIDLFSCHDNGVTSNVVRLFLNGADNYRVNLGLYDGAYDFAAATGNPSTGAWQMATIVATSASNYSAFYNAGGKTTNTTANSINLAAMDRLTLGRVSFSAANFFDGLIGYGAVWNGVALSDSQVTELFTKGPLLVGSPTAYWPLTSNASPEPDDVGSNDLTVTGAAFDSDNPSLILSTATLFGAAIF